MGTRLVGARRGDTAQGLDQPTEPSRTEAWNGHLTACLSCLPLLPKLLREDEKEKYSEMAREWRAAQGKDSGPSEKQVWAAASRRLVLGLQPQWSPRNLREASR